MARIPRQYILTENGFYHVMTRGNSKKEIFKEQSDFLKWKFFLNKYKSNYNTKVIAYCLMPNHYHLLLKSGPLLSKLIGCLNTQYAKYFNRKYELKNHLFGDRFRSFLVADDPYLITSVRYIHNNPVRANLVSEALNYQYSSLMDYLNGNGLTDVSIVEELIDKSFLGTPIVKILS